MSPSQPAVSAAMTLAAKPVPGGASLASKPVPGGASLAADVVGDVWKADWYVAHCYKIPAMAQLNVVLSQVAQAPTRSDISLPSCGPADLKRFQRDLAELISSAETAGKQLSVFLHAVHSTASGLQKDISKRLANENPSVSRNSRRWFPRFPSGGDDFSVAAVGLATSISEAPRKRLDESAVAVAGVANRGCLSATFVSAAQPPKSPTKPTFAARLRSRSMSGVTAAVAMFRSPENAVPRSKDSAVSRGTAEAGADGVTVTGESSRNEVRGSGPFSFRVASPSALVMENAELDGEERGVGGGREAGGAGGAGGAGALRGFLLCGRGMRSDSESGASSSCAEGENLTREGRALQGEGEEGAGRKATGGIAERERAEEVGGKRGKEGAERHGVEESNIDEEIQSDTNIFREAGTDSIAFRHDRASVSMPRAATSAEAFFPSSTGGPLQMARAIARGGVGGSFGGSGPGGAGGGSASAGGMGSPRVWEGMDGQDGISRFHRGMSVAERGERGKGAGGGEGGGGGGSGGGARRLMPTSLSVVSRRGGEWGEEEMGEGWAEGEAAQEGAGGEGGEGSSVGASSSSNSQSPHPLLSPTAMCQPPNGGVPVSPKRPALSKAKLQQEEMLLQLLRSTPPIRWSLASEGNGGIGGSARTAR
ncbi:unnamed protein product [Closterium sp. Yama58-4]|nr:unnamed protein product [Closterium sp. Yama58-4]